MKYEAEIDGRQIVVELNEKEGEISATVEDRMHALKVLRPEEGVYLLLEGDRVYEARVWDSPSGSLNVKLRDRVFDVKIIDRKHRRGALDHGLEGQQQLVAPMPGKVVRVLRAAGDEVEAGQGVVVVEAMKMQNEIKSPRHGRIVEIRVTEGATVNANQVLAV
ncbi:MAG TPA: acetyl-CoA carboxylase biotin carboxyl carrier protein subunit, partial [Blastocatellia bacterium]|nr:acetyl-CoA carboxylase biotin carboxyl carrier protein subunit [Blastocatellia bacterium]